MNALCFGSTEPETGAVFMAILVLPRVYIAVDVRLARTFTQSTFGPTNQIKSYTNLVTKKARQTFHARSTKQLNTKYPQYHFILDNE